MAFTEVFLATQPLVKKLEVNSTALRPASESMAGAFRSGPSRLPPAWKSQLSQRYAPAACQS